MTELKKVPVSALKLQTEKQSTLTEDQVKRIKAFMALLGDIYPESLAETLKNFELDTQPEIEIAVWEKIASVVDMERKDRPIASWVELEDVYGATLYATMADDSDVKQHFGHVRDIDRILSRIRSKFYEQEDSEESA